MNVDFRIFAAANDEAGKALKLLAQILGPHYVLDEYKGKQSIVWRTSKFKAALVLDTDNDVLAFSFMDKGHTAGFQAEGYNCQELIKDIKYNVHFFKPTGKLDLDLQKLRDKFENIK